MNSVRWNSPGISGLAAAYDFALEALAGRLGTGGPEKTVKPVP